MLYFQKKNECSSSGNISSQIELLIVTTIKCSFQFTDIEVTNYQDQLWNEHMLLCYIAIAILQFGQTKLNDIYTMMNHQFAAISVQLHGNYNRQHKMKIIV